MKILIVEDDIDFARVLAKRLATAGYETREVTEAVSAMKFAREFSPDAILLDLMLPGGGGLTVLDRLKVSTYTKNIPVIAVTGNKDEAIKKRALDAGVE